MNKIYKYILIGIGLFGLLFASNYTHGYNYVYNYTTTEYKNFNPGYNDFNINGDICIAVTYVIDPAPQVRNLEHTEFYKELGTITSLKGGIFCTNESFSIYRPYSYGERKGIVIMNLSGQIETCPTCTPQYTSEECQTEYGLVESGLLTSCQTDLNSCITNTSGFNDLLNNCNNNLNACNLSLSSCLQSNCPTTSGDISWSSLFINDIQHIGGPSIYIGIPEEIERNYEYVDDDMYITVDGYNVDNEYIADVIQKTKITPTSEDLSYMIQGLQVYIPYLFIGLIMIFTIALIKRFFRG